MRESYLVMPHKIKKYFDIDDTLLLQKDLEALRSWSENNSLPLNFNKTSLLHLLAKDILGLRFFLQKI